MIRIEIPLPTVPPVRDRRTGKLKHPKVWLNSNDRLHRMAEAKLIALWKQAAIDAAQGYGPIPTPVHITARIWKDRVGRYDAGNLYPTAKACVDGIVDTGLLIDDSNEYVIGPDMRHGGKGEPRIVLEFRPVYKVACPECYVEGTL